MGIICARCDHKSLSSLRCNCVRTACTLMSVLGCWMLASSLSFSAVILTPCVIGLTIFLLSFTPAGLCVWKCFCSSNSQPFHMEGQSEVEQYTVRFNWNASTCKTLKNGAETWAYCSTTSEPVHKNTSERECFAFIARVYSIVKKVLNKLKSLLHFVTCIYMFCWRSWNTPTDFNSHLRVLRPRSLVAEYNFLWCPI